IAYIQNQTNEDTTYHITSYIKKNHSEQYQIIEEIIEHLKSIYKNTNKIKNVKNKYYKLIICNVNNYHKFIIKFLHLISKVKIIKKNYKINFNNKLFFNLRRIITV
ncbi:hypothetical protein ACO22_08118, partial [Paracoccidioides brasiliensis]